MPRGHQCGNLRRRLRSRPPLFVVIHHSHQGGHDQSQGQREQHRACEGSDQFPLLPILPAWEKSPSQPIKKFYHKIGLDDAVIDTVARKVDSARDKRSQIYDPRCCPAGAKTSSGISMDRAAV